MDITFIIGMAGLLVMIFLVTPTQIYKTLKTKQVEGINIITYYTLLFALICYVIRAIAIRELVFILSNGVGIITTLIMICLIYKYKKEDK